MQVRSISLLYFKQAIATKQPDSIQTETMQPMWCNPHISTYLFNTTGLHEGWEKNMQLEYGNEFRFAPSHNFVSKQAISTKQPASIQVVRNCANATHVEQPKYQHCLSNTTGLHQGWKKVMQLEYGNWCRFAPSHCLKQAFATKQPDSIQTVTMQPMWWNPNINICLSNTTGLHQGWKKVMQLEYGNWCRFAPSHCHTSSRQLQPNNLQVPVYKLWQCNPCGETQTSTFACPILRVFIKVGRKSCS